MGRGRQRAKERAAAAQRRATAAAQRVPRTPKFPPEYKEEELKFAQEAEKHQESRQPPVNKQQKPKSEDLPEVKTAEVNNNNPFTNLRYPNQKLEIDSDYLQIDVLKFESSGLGSLQEDKTFKLNTITETINSKKTILGTIFLPIPNQIQDQNGVNWGSDSLNGLAAAGVDAASAVMQSGGVGDAMNTAGNQLNNFTAKILSSGNGGRNAMNAQLSAAIVNAL